MPRPKGSSNKTKKAKKKIEENVQIIKYICTACGNQNQKDFYQSGSSIYKYLGFMNVCKDCIDIEYEKMLSRCSYNVERAMYYICMKLNIPYYSSIIEGAKSQLEKKEGKINRIYFQKLNSFKEANGWGNEFLDGENLFEKRPELEEESNPLIIDTELKIFWGHGFANRDYIFLEEEMNNWKKTHKCDNQSEITLLKEICIKILEIRKKRENGDFNVSKEQKELQDLMKTASVDPAKANVASAGKSLDAFGTWLKDIEQFRPAEWHEQQEKYVDMDGFKKYIFNYIVRPIKNFITGDRDFNIDENIDVSLEDVDDGDE